MQIIITSSKKLFRNDSLVKKLESKGAVFYEEAGLKLEKVKELFNDEEKILAIDYVSIGGGFEAVNKFMPRMRNVKYICALSARYDRFDLKLANKLGITYCNNPDTSSQSVAEMAIMMLFMLTRNYPLSQKKNFEFYGINHLGREVGSLTAGILGYGNIGKRIAKMCDVLGMDVKVWSRSRKRSPYDQVSVSKLLKQDVIFIALPTEPGTKRLFDKKFFVNLEKRHYVIDIAGGDALYDKNKLIRMANEEKIAGYGLEAENPESKYIKATGNVIITPHIAWGTKESYRRMYEGWVRSILECYEGKPVNVVI